MTSNTEKNILLFDVPETHDNLLPLSFTRPVAEFRVGILTIREKWQLAIPGTLSHLPVDYLRDKFSPVLADDNLFIAGHLLPDSELTSAILELKEGDALCLDGKLIAARGQADVLSSPCRVIDYTGTPALIAYPYDIFLLNAKAIESDFEALTAGRASQAVPDDCRLIGAGKRSDGLSRVFIEEGAELCDATLNVSAGPIYIGRDATVMEGALLRGPLAVCDNAKIRMGAKIYGGSTFGPYCKVGGEVDNAVMFAYSNKAHDGYLGNAVVGEWCNIGAGANASNLKNDYSKIRLWNYPTHSFRRTDLQFCGLIMADHSKAGINCMFNTATVLGVGVNIHGAGFPRTFIPSFSEGSPVAGFTNVPLKKFYQIAERAMSRRGIELTDLDRKIYENIFAVASKYKTPSKKI